MDRIKLILLCGIPGSGKTTYVQRRIKQHGGVHLSSDLIRKELYGDESIQGNPSEVFSLMQSRAIEALNNGETIEVDENHIIALQGFQTSQIQAGWSVGNVLRGEGLSLMNITGPGKVFLSPLPIIIRTQ